MTTRRSPLASPTLAALSAILITAPASAAWPETPEESVLIGIAEGTFLDQPYEREMEFVLRPEAEVWRVEGFHFGEILTEVPRLLELE